MSYKNFICYRGNTIGDNFGGRLAKELNEEADIIGTSFFSTQQETLDSNFILDLEKLLLHDCSVFILMLTENFFEGFMSEDGSVNQNSVTRLELELALKNRNMKFISVVFSGFSWNDANRKILESTVSVSDPSEYLRIISIPSVECPNQRDRTIINAISDVKKRLVDASERSLVPVADPAHTRLAKDTIVVDGINIDLIKVAKGAVEDNYHLLLTKADMDVFINGETFEIIYLYEGKVKKLRKDVNGIFLNILTPSNNSDDTRYAFGYDLIADPEKKNCLNLK